MKFAVRIIWLFIILIFTLSFVGCGKEESVKTENESLKNEFTVTPAKSVTNFDYNPKDAIVCWGDSITEGYAMATGYSYPKQLQGNIGSQFKVLNAGVGGETSAEIMSRANAIDTVLTVDLYFPTGESKVYCDKNSSLVSPNGESIVYKNTVCDLSKENVIISGERYKFTAQSSNYCFERADVSAPLTIPKGTKITFDYSDTFTSQYCNVILMGANDGNLSAEQVAENYKIMAATSERNIFIIPFYRDDITEELITALGDTYGKQVVDLRGYVSGDYEKDYGVTLGKRDVKYIERNILPPSLTYKPNDVHLNEMGYKVLGDLVYEKGVQLGYWK